MLSSSKSKKMQSSRRGARGRNLFLVAAGTVAVAANVAFATNFTWTRAANNNWDNAGNWSSTPATAPPQVQPVGDTTDIVYAGTQATVNTSSSMRQDYSVNSLFWDANFNHGSTNTFSLNTPSTLLAPATSAHLTIGAGGITSNVGLGTITYNINITKNTAVANADLILAADQTWATNAPAASTGAITFTVTRQITGGNFVVTKTGTGVLVLAMTAANSGWTGGVNLVEGSIRTGGLTSGHNGHFGTGPIRHSSANDVTITASTVNSAGGDRLFDNDLILGGTGRFTLGGSFNLSFTSNSEWQLTADKNLGVSNVSNHDGTITGGFALNKFGGGMLVLNGANTYTGATTINEGVVQVRNNTALGTGTGNVTVVGGGTLGAALELSNNVAVAGRPLSIAGTGVLSLTPPVGVDANAGALRNRSGNNEWSGPVTVTAADTYVAVDAGELNLSGGVSAGGGSNSVRAGGAGLLRVKNLQLEGLALDAAARVRVNPDGTAAGRSNLGSLSVAGGFATPTAQLDLSNNALVVQGQGVTVANVEALIRAGYAAGAWTGFGIVSSTAAATPGTGVGYADGASIPSNPLFGTLLPGAVVARYTLLGDADLSGTVNIGDFSALAANFNTAGGWSSGDFDYDGQVGIGDFSLLAAAFNQGLPASLPRGSAVPEPASAAALAAVALGLAARRRRG